MLLNSRSYLSQTNAAVRIREYRSELYTISIMTSRTVYVIVGLRKKGPQPQVRKGKAMLQMYTDRMKNTYRLFDLQGTIMPPAKHAEGLICVCLNKTGSSGYLGSGAFARAKE